MRAARGQRDQRIAGRDAAAVDDAALLHHADAEAREVVILALVHAGHLGGLAADQRAARLLAAGADALDDPGRHVDVEPAGGVVIEEEQRFGAGDHEVVDAHRHQVDADAVVDAELHRQAQLGADTVGAGDQHRFLVALGNLAQRAEAAEPAQHLGAPCAARHALDVRDQGIAGVDIDPRILVGETVIAGFGHGRSPSLGRAILAAGPPAQQTASGAV